MTQHPEVAATTLDGRLSELIPCFLATPNSNVGKGTQMY